MELKRDVPNFSYPNHGSLAKWASQGILLLNSTLTVRANAPNSHVEKGWSKLTDAIVKLIDAKCKNCVFLLWGAYAREKGELVNKSKHHVLTTGHPSPRNKLGFLGCGHFSETNRVLKRLGKKEIEWQI